MSNTRKITNVHGNGNDFRGANINNENSFQNNYYGSADRTPALDALRTALDTHGDRVVALGRTADEQAALRHEVTATRGELAADEPRGAAVRFHWDAVLAILGTTLAMNADVAQITQFVMDLFS